MECQTRMANHLLICRAMDGDWQWGRAILKIPRQGRCHRAFVVGSDLEIEGGGGGEEEKEHECK